MFFRRFQYKNQLFVDNNVIKAFIVSGLHNENNQISNNNNNNNTIIISI